MSDQYDDDYWDHYGPEPLSDRGWRALRAFMFVAPLVAIFAGGFILGGHLEPTPPPVVVETPSPVPYGDFNDVSLDMKTTMGNTWFWLCDLHFPPPPEPRTAECENDYRRTP